MQSSGWPVDLQIIGKDILRSVTVSTSWLPLIGIPKVPRYLLPSIPHGFRHAAPEVPPLTCPLDSEQSEDVQVGW